MTRTSKWTKWLAVSALSLGLLAAAPVRAQQTELGSYSTRSKGYGGYRSALGASVGGWDYAALVSLDIAPHGWDAGPRLTGEFMYGLADLAPELRLDIGGRLSWAYHNAGPYSVWLLDMVPDLKLQFTPASSLAIYGDLAIGPAIFHAGDTQACAAIQIGFGVSYALTSALNLLGEMRFDIYTRSGTGTFVALPTVGLQFH